MLEIFALPDDTAAPAWARSAGVELVVVGEEALKRLSSTQAPQSPVATIEIPENSLNPTRSLLVAWQISDPGNLGTMIRTAAAFGLDVGVMPGSVDPWSPKVLRAAAGGHFQTGVASVEALADLDAITVATVVGNGQSPRSLPPGRLALLIGSEAHGLPDDVVADAALRVSIPMAGPTESLNAAAAAAILAYEVANR
jgi:TrmH family RNA methyltransferase